MGEASGDGERYAPGTALVVSGDLVRAGRLAQALSRAALVVTVAFDDVQARACLRDVDVHVIVADLSGPAPDEAIKDLRRRSQAPILGLVRGSPVGLERLFRRGLSAVAALDGSPEDLGAQVRSLLGLGGEGSWVHPRVLRMGSVEVDTRRRSVRVDDVEVALTPIQLRLLTVLMAAQGDVVSHDTIYRLLWRSEVDDDGQRLAAHVHRLRDRLGEDPNAPRLLVTVRGEGYRLAGEAPALEQIASYTDGDGSGGAVIDLRDNAPSRLDARRPVAGRREPAVERREPPVERLRPFGDRRRRSTDAQLPQRGDALPASIPGANFATI